MTPEEMKIWHGQQEALRIAEIQAPAPEYMTMDEFCKLSTEARAGYLAGSLERLAEKTLDENRIRPQLMADIHEQDDEDE